MELFLVVAAGVWTLVGFGVLSSAKSVMHEILAAIMFSSAVIFVGIACMIYRLRPQTEDMGVRQQTAQRSHSQEYDPSHVSLRGVNPRHYR